MPNTNEQLERERELKEFYHRLNEKSKQDQLRMRTVKDKKNK